VHSTQCALWRADTGQEFDICSGYGDCNRHSRRAVSSFMAGVGGLSRPVVHSSEYRNPTPYPGKRVLVVGFGNSGGEIEQIYNYT